VIAPFRVGLTPDFYSDAKGYFERPVHEQFSGVSNLEYGPMPPQPNKVATPEALNQIDGLVALALRITVDSLKGVDRLAVVARWGVGYDMIDVPALTEAGIALCITPSGVRRPVAEAILTFVFALLKNLFPLDRMTRVGQWRAGMNRLGRDIPGHVLGSVGCGNIARELFRLARPLGFSRMIACDPAVTQDQVDDLGVEMVEMDRVFRESDFVTINTLLNKATEGLIGPAQFRLMKPSAYFINTARGPIVQHDALVTALRERWIAGAGIDVFPSEPPPQDDPLFELDNVIVAPHALAWTEDGMYANGTEACQHVLEVSRGEIPAAIVNADVIQHSRFLKKLERYR
jgi:phosphoglycerate dehydrogenase-like enzyme